MSCGFAWGGPPRDPEHTIDLGYGEDGRLRGWLDFEPVEGRTYVARGISDGIPLTVEIRVVSVTRGERVEILWRPLPAREASL